MKKEFETDYRKVNPGLHLLYVKWAIRELVLIDNTIRAFENEGKTTLIDIIIMLHNERKKLIESDAAFADAEEVLKSIQS